MTCLINSVRCVFLLTASLVLSCPSVAIAQGRRPAIPAPRLPQPASPSVVRLWGVVTCPPFEACPPHPIPWMVHFPWTIPREWRDWRAGFPADYFPPFNLSPVGESLLPHVSVAAIDVSNGMTWETRTNRSGRYWLTVPPGDYRVVVDEPPYAPYETFVSIPDIELTPPNPLVDGEAASGADFIPPDATRLDVSLTADADPTRCPAMSCTCARCLVFDAFESAVEGIQTPVNGAEVVVTNTEGRRWYARTQGGLVVFSTLPEGWYYFTATYPSQPFRVGKSLGWQYVGGPQKTTRANIVFGAGEYIEVVASPTTLNTIEGAGGGAKFTQRFVESAPLASGRTLQSLQTLVPGVVFTEQTGTLAQFTAIGARRFSNRLSIDGIAADLAIGLTGTGIGEEGSGALPGMSTAGSTQTLIPLASIQEVSIRTTNATSEHARAPGAQTSIVTRSGTDRLAASAFLDFRPNALSASDWFVNAGQAPERELSFWNAGASLGGPILPGRLFYFATWEQQHVNRPVEMTTEVPSMSARGAVPDNLRPLLDAYPTPNGAILGNNLAEFSSTFPAQSKLSVFNVRVDGHVKQHRMFARVNIGRSHGDSLDSLQQMPMSSFTQTERTVTKTATIGVSSMRAALVNDVRVNISTHRGWSIAGPARFGDAQALPVDLLLPREAAGPSFAILNLFPGPHGQVFSGQIGPNSQRQIQVVDTVSFVRGRHEWRTGVDYRYVLASSDGPQTQVMYRFGAVTDVLQGRVRQVAVNTVAPSKALFQSWSLFIQDTYRPWARLSMDYGIRYSVEPAPASRTELSPSLIDFERLPEVSQRPITAPLWNTSRANIAPRVAASYTLGTRADRETVLRAGWSLVFDQLTRPGAASIGRSHPFVATRVFGASAFPVPADSLTVVPSEPFGPGDRGEYFAFPRDFRSPRAYNWRVGLDQALGRGQRVSAAYVGAAGRDLPYWSVYYVGSPTPIINAYSNDGRSDYHALVTEVMRQMSRGLSGRVAYTWSHSIDNDSGDSLRPYAPPSLIPPSTNRGSSDFDRRHVLQATSSYEIPAGRLPWRLYPLLGGWQFDMVGTFQSGAPFSVMSNRSLGNGTYFVRPDVVPGVPLWIRDATSPTGTSLNPVAFQTIEGRQGTLGRNALRASSLRQVDVLLVKTIRLRGRMSAQLRVQAFNVLNTVNVGPPFAIYPGSQFGRPFQTYAQGLGTGTLAYGGLLPIQQVGGPRSLQFGLRFSM